MKIGIHNIIPAVGYVMYTTACVFLTLILFDKFDTQALGTLILWSLLILASYTMFGMMSYHLKFILLTEKEIKILKPFWFQFRTIRFDDIISVDWGIWPAPKLGDYRKLMIRTNNYKIHFSDFEFINFNGLEKFILDRTRVISKFNLTTKQNVELAQARENRWWNLVAILVMSLFLILFSIDGKTGTPKLVIQVLLAVLIVRVAIVFFEYQNRIKNSVKRNES